MNVCIWDKTAYDGETLILELSEMCSTSWLLLLPGLLRSRVVVPDRVSSMNHIKLFNYLKSKNKVGDRSQGWPENTLFNSFSTEV